MLADIPGTHMPRGDSIDTAVTDDRYSSSDFRYIEKYEKTGALVRDGVRFCILASGPTSDVHVARSSWSTHYGLRMAVDLRCFINYNAHRHRIRDK